MKYIFIIALLAIVLLENQVQVQAKGLKGSLALRASSRESYVEKINNKKRESAKVITANAVAVNDGGLPESLKLVIGAGGIYAAFLYYGAMQEEVFSFKAEDGSMFKSAWFLQVLEAAANVLIGSLGLKLTGGATKGLPIKIFMMGGASQVCAKACTSLALASGPTPCDSPGHCCLTKK